MKTQAIARRLAELCVKGDFETAQTELYGDDVISIEPQATKEYDKETRGKKAVLDKIKKFNSQIDVSYGNKVSDPLVAGNSIAFILSMDVAMKGQKRQHLEELCVYEVKDGKIISEQFFL